MKAIVWNRGGGSDVLKLSDMEMPVVKDGEILIRIRGAVVSPTDCVNTNGASGLAKLAARIMFRKRQILGEMLAGDVEAVGKGVTRFAVGDRVYGSAGMGLGAYAEYITLPEGAALACMPANLGYGEAASLCDGALTSLGFLRDCARIAAGQSLLVYGASGSLGTYAIQLARYYGAAVTGVCSTGNMEMVKSLGAENVIDYTREDYAQMGHTYDIVFDTVAKSSFSHGKSALTSDGIFMVTVPTPAVLFSMLLRGRRRGGKKAAFAANGLKKPVEKSEDLAFLTGLAESGHIRPVVDRVYPLEQMAEAQRYVRKGHKRGNVLIAM
jgi:NADPH:quinone reductase-like Zn-dependent oxidoreductase